MTVKLRPTHVPERWRGYLSTEQIYEAEPLNASSGSYWVDSPRGPGGSPTRWLVLIDGCAHLDGHPWEVVEGEDSDPQREALLGALVDAYRELVVREDSPAAIDHEFVFHEITGRIAERLEDDAFLEELERRIQSENPV